MANSDHEGLSEVVTAIANLHRSLGEKYILVGGASLILLGSKRLTYDVDLLLPRASIPRLAFTLTESQTVTYRAGVIYSTAGASEFPVDILTEIVNEKTFEDLEPFTVILGGIRTLDFPIALGIKILCCVGRDESISGVRKQESDVLDIIFICNEMQKTGKIVDELVAKAVPIGCYKMQLAKDLLAGTGDLALFLSVGGHKFQVPWAEDTDEQREYFTMLTADYVETADQVDV